MHYFTATGKIMMSLVVLVSIVSLASCAGPEPTRCCQDRQWTGTLTGVGGTVYPHTGNSVPIDSVTTMMYDYYRKRIYLDITFYQASDATRKVTRSILDYSNDRQYLFQEDGQCTISKIGDAIQEPCVEPSAKFLKTDTMGFGTETIKINTWEIVKPGTDIVVKRSYTEQGCVPVMEAFYGTVNGASMNLVQTVSNFRPGIADPTYLDLPAIQNCTFVDQNGPVYGRR